MNDKDIFEILGINSREDSYTDLIGHAFNNSAQFKSNFCMEFAGYLSDDFNLKIRNAQVHIDLSSKKKEVPDMLLISEEHNEIILIENKIFSNESENQTLHYSEKAFVESVKIQNKMKNAKFEKFYFLTLDGDQAISEKFISKKWSDLIMNIAKNTVFEDPRLSILISDLIKRSNHYDQGIKCELNSSFLQYFKNCEKWVSPIKAFKNMSLELVKKIEGNYPVKVSYSGSTSNGKQLLIIFNNENWNLYNIKSIREKISNASDLELIKFAKCRNIHIEVNWKENSNKLTQFIHYESNPYLTYKELDKLSREFAVAFEKNKAIFRDEILKDIPKGWRKNSRKKYLAPIKTQYVLSEANTFQEVINWIESNFKTAFECIERALSTIDEN